MTPTPSEELTPPPMVEPTVPPPLPPPPTQPPPPGGRCPVAALKACVDLTLFQLIRYPSMARQECCPPIDGLSSTEAASCMCSAFKLRGFDVGDGFSVPFIRVTLSLCTKAVPQNIMCF
ncbi:hypothetical protein ABZP36_018844 [Zizania latifolia]